jgi:hypothetical protein
MAVERRKSNAEIGGKIRHFAALTFAAEAASLCSPAAGLQIERI